MSQTKWHNHDWDRILTWKAEAEDYTYKEIAYRCLFEGCTKIKRVYPNGKTKIEEPFVAYE